MSNADVEAKARRRYACPGLPDNGAQWRRHGLGPALLQPRALDVTGTVRSAGSSGAPHDGRPRTARARRRPDGSTDGLDRWVGLVPGHWYEDGTSTRSGEPDHGWSQRQGARRGRGVPRQRADVIIVSPNADRNQRWAVEPLDDGTVRLVAAHTALVPGRRARFVQWRWHGGATSAGAAKASNQPGAGVTSAVEPSALPSVCWSRPHYSRRQADGAAGEAFRAQPPLGGRVWISLCLGALDPSGEVRVSPCERSKRCTK